MNTPVTFLFALALLLLAPGSRLPSYADDALPTHSLIALDDIQGANQTLVVGADGGLMARTIDESGERIHRDTISREQLEALVAFIRASGILDQSRPDHAETNANVQPKILLRLPGAKKVSTITPRDNNAASFKEVYARLWQLVESTLKARGYRLQQQAKAIHSARKVVANEFAGYDAAKRIPLNSVVLTPADKDRLADVMLSPELAVEPTDGEYALCFIPHHSVSLTEGAGEPYEIVICLECHKIAFPKVRRAVHITKAARDRLSEFFGALKMPVRTSDEYMGLDRQAEAASR
jgi:hypothetical protein